MRQPLVRAREQRHSRMVVQGVPVSLISEDFKRVWTAFDNIVAKARQTALDKDMAAIMNEGANEGKVERLTLRTLE